MVMRMVMFKNYGDDISDVYLYLVMTMMTFNYGDVLVFDVMLCITWWVCPHACKLELSIGKMVMNRWWKSLVIHLGQLGDDRCGTTFILVLG